LKTAVGRNRFEIVKLLLANGADAASTDPQGLTSLRIAMLRGYDDIANLLKSRTAR
jgi:ankyrin repeat protein